MGKFLVVLTVCMLASCDRTTTAEGQDGPAKRDLGHPADLLPACGSLTTASNCGACGNACPGEGLPSDDVTCSNPATKTCALTCRGENYDVNGDPKDGCEKLNNGPPDGPGHTMDTAKGLGSQSCNDGTMVSFSGTILSDSRVHTNPAVEGFLPTVGSAPDYWSVFATGGVCENDYAISIVTTGGGATPCYQFTIFTGEPASTQSAILAGSDSKDLSSGEGSYTNDTGIVFEMVKTCSLPVQEAVTYHVSYHL